MLRTFASLLDPGLFARLRDSGVLDPHPARVMAALRAAPRLLDAPLGAAVRLHAGAQPDRTAVVDRHGRLTWAELDARVNRLTRVLRDLGLTPGGTVATVLRNGREQVEVLTAAMRVGAATAPLNTWAQAPEMRRVLDRVEPEVLVYDVRHEDQLEGAIPDPTRVIRVGDDYEAQLSRRPHEPLTRLPRRIGAPPVLIHTSGTTSTPKAAERDAGPGGAALMLSLLRTIPYRRDDVVLCPAPLFHSFGLLTCAIAATLGTELVLPDRFDAAEAVRTIARERVTAASLVPVMLRRLVGLPDEDLAGADLSSLRVVLVSGSVLPAALRERARQVLGGVMYDLYGSTEAGIVAIASPDDLRDRPETVGRVLPGVEVVLFGPEGREVDPGAVGEVHVRSAGLFGGYRFGEETPERDGYLATGDLGRLHDDGYLEITGRADDLVVVGGENVHATEVQAAIEELDGVVEAAVLGVPDEEYGQVLVAHVEGSTDAEAIRSALQRELPSFKVPREISVVDELPRTGTGKVRRSALEDGTD